MSDQFDTKYSRNGFCFRALLSIKRINHVTADRLNTIVFLTNHLACKYRASREFDRVIFLVLF